MHTLQTYIETLIAVLIVFFAPITGMIIFVANEMKKHEV